MASIRLWGRVLMAALCSKSNHEFYDRISPVYDQCFVTHRLHADNMADWLSTAFRGHEKDTRVLDLGCGTGMLAKILNDRGFEAVGSDISLDSLQLLHAQQPGISVIQADAGSLPFADSSCHGVASLGAWRHFPDPGQVLSEVARVLKDNGVLVIGYFPPALGGVFQHADSPWHKWLVRLYQYLVGMRGYVDHVDVSLEPLTVSQAAERFAEVSVVDSGQRWHLIIARNPVRS